MHALRAELSALLTDAGALALDYVGRSRVEIKSDGSPVTDADRAVEELIVERLTRAFPDDGIVSEEGCRIEGRSGAVWHVDPIDGTSSYLRRMADWGPTVCRVTRGRLEVGGYYAPRLREHWFAGLGYGAWRDGVRFSAREPREVTPEDVVFAPSRFHRAPNTPWPGKVRALGSTAAHLAYVAADAGLATIIPKWNLWDVGCGVLLVREAGRVIWGPAGETVEPESVAPESSIAPVFQHPPLLVGSPAALRLFLAGDWARDVLDRRRRAVAG